MVSSVSVGPSLSRSAESPIRPAHNELPVDSASAARCILKSSATLAVGESRDQVELPQWPVAVEWAAVDACDEFGERGGVVGIGHRDVAQVVIEIESRMVAPPRPVESQRHVDE